MKKISKEKLHLPKIEGITLRWLINIIGVIVVFFIIVFIISAFAIKNTYYSNVESILNSGASSTAVSYFSANLDVGNTLEQSATEYIDSYSYKEKTTTWIIDNDGKVVVSSSGFAIEKQEMPDYEEALASDSNKSKYIGKISNGEKVMAVCRIIKDSNGDNVGAIRVLSSLEQIDRQVATLTFLVFIGLVIVFALIIFSNLFFIRSIIFPVQEITETTKKISQGDYSVRIEKKYDDEIGNLCDSINTMAEEISTTDKMKNDFISTISHELRTPLTSIKGWGETLMLSTDDTVDELTRKGLQVIVKEAGRLEGFVEELLDFSRLQSGRMNLRLAKTDLFAELDETVFTFRERALREGIEVKYSIPEVPAVANADANRLKQVFMNILDNALKYSRAPSKIFVKAEFTKLENENFVKIAIADQGCGISKEDLPHVKEKFYKELDEYLYDKYETFASNPLLLTIMLLTFESRVSIPDKLNDFFEQAFTTLFHTHDATKGGYKRDICSGLGYEDFKTVFAYFCFKSFFNSDYRFSENKVLEYIGIARQKRVVEVNFDSMDFLIDLTNSVCMLIHDGLEYRFSHRSFQEYFAALYTVQLDDEQQKKFLKLWLQDDDYRTTSFYLDMLYELETSRFVKNVIIPGIRELQELFEKNGKREEWLITYLYNDVCIREEPNGEKKCMLSVKDSYYHDMIWRACNIGGMYKNVQEERKQRAIVSKDKLVEIIEEEFGLNRLVKFEEIMQKGYAKEVVQYLYWARERYEFAVNYIDSISVKYLTDEKDFASMLEEL